MLIKHEINNEKGYNLIIINDEDYELINEAIRLYKKNDKSKSKIVEDKFDIVFTNIICYGETKEIAYKTLSKIIPSKNYHLAPRSNSGNSYKCYATNKPSIVLHECVTTSWNCLMSVLGHPEFVLIYKIENSKVDEIAMETHV